MECKPGAYFSNPGLRVWPHSNPGTRVWHMVGHLSVANSQIVYYKQLRGGQMEVWLTRYLDDLRRSVPVLHKRQLKQHHMSTTSTRGIHNELPSKCYVYWPLHPLRVRNLKYKFHKVVEEHRVPPLPCEIYISSFCALQCLFSSKTRCEMFRFV